MNGGLLWEAAFFMKYLGTNMLIKVVMVIFIILLLITAAYLWFNREKISLATGGKQDNLLKLTACALLVVSIIGVLILFIGDKLLNVVTLVLACLVILNLGLRLGRK
jgi:uncharacterized iron-regulated membrane protein